MTEEEMEGPISFWGYKEQESNLILPEHDDDDDEFPIMQHTCYRLDMQKQSKESEHTCPAAKSSFSSPASYLFFCNVIFCTFISYRFLKDVISSKYDVGVT